jgi:iron complex transport system permease protein
MTRFTGALVLAAVAVLLLVIVAFAVGRYPISMTDLAAAIWGRITGSSVDPNASTIQTIVFSVRGPRILAALAIGAALAAAGAA